MSASKAPASAVAWIPADLAISVKRRALQLCGAAICAASLAYAAALVSYSPADPSWNHATTAPVGNLFGHSGAVLADVSLHAFGLGAAMLVLAGIVWGLRLLTRQRPPGPAWRVCLALAAIPLASVAAAAVPTPSAWSLAAGLGGVFGDILLWQVLGMAGFVNPHLIAALVGLVATVATGVALCMGLGIHASHLRRAYETARHTSLSARQFARALVRRCAAGGESIRETLQLPPMDVADTPAAPCAPVAGPAAPVVAPRAPKMRGGRTADVSRQGNLDLGDSGYQRPPIDLLKAPQGPRGDTVDRDALQQNARLLATVLDDFGVRGDIVKVRPGPVITLYELEPAPGTKSSRVIGLADDIARSMSAISVRVAVVPGRNVIGIELPNHNREMVYLRELLASEAFERSKGHLTLALGKDIGGGPVFVDLARMPHLLIAGTTGSGKSVAINTMILSLLYQLSPDACKLILIDPKMLELSVYDGIPHLLSPVVTEPAKAVVALKWTVREMEERYRMMAQLNVRNISGFNARVKEAQRRGETLVRTVQTGFDDDGRPVMEEQPLDLEPLPFIVVVVDEMADLMLVAGKDIEAAVQRLAQMARAAGIHMIMATQRPSVDVITGTIKANFPTRVSFQVTSKIDSRTILGEQGAEQLLGQGDMLHTAGGGRLTRVHGPFVSDEEVETVVSFLRQQGEPAYLPEVTEEDPAPALAGDDGNMFGGSPGDGLYDEAVALVARDGKASTSYVQRRLQIGYNRAARLIERMEAEGVVSRPDRVGRREVLVGDHSS